MVCFILKQKALSPEVVFENVFPLLVFRWRCVILGMFRFVFFVSLVEFAIFMVVKMQVFRHGIRQIVRTELLCFLVAF